MERDPSLTEAASKVELSIGEYGSLSFPLHHRIQRLNSYPHSAKTAQLISPEQLNRVLSFDDVSAEIRYEAATCLIGLLNSGMYKYCRFLFALIDLLEQTFYPQVP
jgi:hypothetical protein